MKIVQVANNTLPVPPPDYGGTQRVIDTLSRALAEMGHDIILFAPKGSSCEGNVIEYPSHLSDKLAFVRERLPEDVDIIHDHGGTIAEARLSVPTLCTIHTRSRLDIPYPVYVSKTLLRGKGKGKGYYVHNGIDMKDYPLKRKKEAYLLFIGRMMNKKGVHYAIETAKSLDMPLVLAGPVPKRRHDYFDEKVKPHIDGKQISYVGSVGGKEKINLISRARCVLFPTNWSEPFGLVPIEAMACGTPAVCFRNGAVSETMKGFPELTCDTVEEMIHIVKKGDFPSPKKMRKYVKKRFSAKAMAKSYLKLYQKIIREYPGKGGST
ncbi:MAG: glycosyltransferase [Bacillaceae bacterium]|nr:glycosyltransferase [Bacillaceae bacterium]